MAHVVIEGPKGTSKYVYLKSRSVVSSETNHRMVANQLRRSRLFNGLSHRGNALT